MLELSLQRQCELVGISRSGFYYQPVPQSPENPRLDAAVGLQLHLEHPVYGSRRLAALLRREGQRVNRKRVGRLFELMGVEVIYPKRNLSQAREGHRIYPYLLEGLEISGPTRCGAATITYVPMACGFMYLVAVMELVEPVCAGLGVVEQPGQRVLYPALTGALAGGRQPLISNTDQGSQITSEANLEAVEAVGVDVSMGWTGRWIDNRSIERLWRSVKQEDIYVQDYADGLTAQRGLARWFGDYTPARRHQALGYATPGEWYEAPESYGAKPAPWRWATEVFRCPPSARSFDPGGSAGLTPGWTPKL